MECIARLNDVSRLLHQFVLCLYPCRREACAGLRWLVSKVIGGTGTGLAGGHLGASIRGHTAAALRDATSTGLVSIILLNGVVH